MALLPGRLLGRPAKHLLLYLFCSLVGVGFLSAQIQNGDFETNGLDKWMTIGGVTAGLGLPPTPGTGAHMEAGAPGVVQGGRRYQLIQQTFNCPGGGVECYVSATLQHLPGNNETAFMWLQHAGGAVTVRRIPNIPIAANRKIFVQGCGTVTVNFFRRKIGGGNFTGDLYIDNVQGQCRPNNGGVPFPGVPFLTTISCPAGDPNCDDLTDVEALIAQASIPTLSDWGLILLALLVLAIGTGYLFTVRKRGREMN